MSRTAADWRPFVWEAIGVAATAGFGLGGALLAAAALGFSLGAWCPTAARANGHARLFGWAGSMVLGVGVHFLPRLLGGPPPPSRHVRVALGRRGACVLSRVFADPASATGVPDGALPWLGVGLAGSGVLEPAGANLAVGLLAHAVPRGPTAGKRADRLAVLPFVAVAFRALARPCRERGRVGGRHPRKRGLRLGPD